MRLARLLPIFFVVFCAASPARAETAGQVLAAVGDALALRAGQIVRLVPGASVESGDQINTGASSYLQIRFTDWSIVYLRPRTNFVVDEYFYEARQGGRDRAFFSLLSGGIRSITGAIGHRDRANYRLRAPITTIGIRGTHFSVLMCKQDCRNPDGTLGEDGLYGEVLDGRIAVSPYGGSALEREFGAGERFRLANENSIPLQLPSLPPFFPDGLDSHARSSAKPASPISSAGRVVPGAGSAVTDQNPVPGVTGGLVSTLTSIVPAKPDARSATALVGSVGAPISEAVIRPLEKGVVLPAEGLAGSLVNSALSMPALGPAFPLLGTLPITTPTLPITAPTLPITTPTLPITTPTLPITAPTLPITTPTLPITTPTLPVTTTPLPVTTTPLPVTTTPLPVTTTPLPITTTPLPVTTTPLPVTTTPLPITTTPLPVTTTPLPVTTTPLPVVTAPTTSTVSLPTVPSLPLKSGLTALPLKK